MGGDPCSFANAQDVQVTHSDFEFCVDFDEKVLVGYVQHTAVAKTAGVTQLCLDTRDVKVTNVSEIFADGADTPLEYKLGEPNKALGTQLTVSLPAGLEEGDQVVVGIHYTTSKTCSAIQFLDPKQTAEGTHPYLFSQCQAIHARSMVPCQDLPAAKMSYNATVWVPEELTALMSAVPVEEEDESNAKRRRTMGPSTVKEKAFKFVQKVPIPTYLIALAVGKLESREIGPRSRVWSEASMVEAGAYEFAETETFLAAGEKIAGDYVWGRYDILLLPPSFPYGGMENPCLTFVTPTLLAGDRSQANVVAHEIAHSWCGNLVTNRTWEHFWLNEGFTVFLERNILMELHGEPTFHFHALGGLKALEDSVAQFGAEHPFTALVPDLSSGVDPDDSFSRIPDLSSSPDPDDAFSSVPYEKGFNFLYYLQTIVGGKDQFLPFFKAFIANHAYKTVDSMTFKEAFLTHFEGHEALSAVDWETWLYKPGMPPVKNQFDKELITKAQDLAKKWHFGDVLGTGNGNFEGLSADDLKGWSGEQVTAFLEELLTLRSMQPLAENTTKLMNDLYQLDDARNSEIRFRWFKLAIQAEAPAVLPHVTAFLAEQGRMKYVRPLYRALHRSKMGKELGLATFKEHRESYHPIAQKMLAQDLGI